LAGNKKASNLIDTIQTLFLSAFGKFFILCIILQQSALRRVLSVHAHSPVAAIAIQGGMAPTAILV
jgi:hypothetical protein